jgi:uncharacterized Fe-S radical SAM superfamily protein PflX
MKPKLRHCRVQKYTSRFCLKNKTDIYLNDVEYRNKYEEEKGNELKKLLKAAQKELNFQKKKRKAFRIFTGIQIK